MAGRSYEIVGSDGDAGVLLSIADHDGAYAEGVSALVAARLAPDGVAFDVGANIGVLTVLLSDLAPEGRIVAFEPAPQNVGYLRTNVAGRNNVEIVEAAVGATDGTLRFDANLDYPAGAHVAEAGATIVSCRSIDSWIEERGLTRLDVVKIDVEGAEPQVLAGAANAVARFRPLIVAECNVASLRRVSGTGFTELRAQLAALVPTVGLLHNDGSIVPLESDEHLELALGAEGVVDLVGYWDRRRLAPAIRARQHLRRLHRATAADTPPDPHNFVVTAPIDLAVESPGPRRWVAGDEVDLVVRVANGSRWWLSSDFVYHPVNVGARWTEGAEAGRASFAEPVPPGGAATVTLRATLPSSAGRHILEITLVQEHFSWIADLDPRCATTLEFEVSPE